MRFLARSWFWVCSFSETCRLRHALRSVWNSSRQPAPYNTADRDWRGNRRVSYRIDEYSSPKQTTRQDGYIGRGLRLPWRT
jgi:hypothetical protein